MKALVIRQPWADLIVDGHKTVENRTWTTKYRGPLLIVAAKALDRGAHCDALSACRDAGVLDVPDSYGIDAVAFFAARDFGAIIGQVDLVDISDAWPSPWAFAGHKHWRLANARRFDAAIPCKGRLGLFDVDIADAIVAAAVEAHHLKGQTP